MKRLVAHVLTLFAVLAGIAFTGSMATAQSTYPARPITLVVPYPPGGSNDVFARRLARGLGEALGQPVVIDNKPGAAGNIGTAFVAKAAPDGYTLVAISSSMTSNAAVQANLQFDPVKSFAPVAQIAKGPFIVAVNQEFPARTPAEFLAVVKQNPGKFNYASSGTGSSNQFATEAFKVLTSTFIVHVPYRGMGPAVTDLVGNQVQMLFASGPSLLPQIRSGKLRAIGITSLNTSPIAPDLKPMSSVAPGYQFELWWGVLAPTGTPPDVVAKLNAAINKFCATPEMKAFFLHEGAEHVPLTAAEFTGVIASDVPRWRALARKQSITAD
ncbi:MAG: tripartite tricarboxylate transporter substrate binding protein [Burkholderiales bacterium]|nr:tripartite tricarboxylate transporter substrate binding protein [Burkholderiales bacterium]